MNEFPIAAIRHVPGSATSACEIVLTKANADLFRNVAARVVALARGMQQYKARSLVAEDYASCLIVRYQQDGMTAVMRLKSVTFDCGSGRDPCVTLKAKDGSSLRPTLSKAQFESLVAFDSAEIALREDEASCKYCGYTNDSTELAASPSCAMCAKPAVAPAETCV